MFGTKGEIVVLTSNIRLKLKTKKLKTIYDDIIGVPDVLQTDIELYFLSFKVYHCGIWYFGAFLMTSKMENISNKLRNDDIINL